MNYNNITADIHFLCGTTSASYPLADITRNVNIEYNNVSRLIWESQGSWQYDDSNATTLPIAKATMVHGQQDYSLPSTTQRVERVEVKDSSGNWQKLIQIDLGDVSIALPEYLETAGMPVHYDLIGRSLMLYPKPSSAYATLASGLAVYVNRDVTEFPTTATTTEPGFAKPYHRILSYGASLDFVQDTQQRQFLAAQKARLEQGLVRFYSRRDVEHKTTVRPASKRSWRQFV